ncbi:MAG: hypothetical protein LPK02_05950 [Rhodobacterales bacterium]|nr:hypothetical protein [Rhodobacterales bacterium]MDX5412569.1 hypothetical protein [Rhodobacterales bacterium]
MTRLCNLRFCFGNGHRIALFCGLIGLIGLGLPGLTPVHAAEIVARPYAALQQELDRIEGFEGWPARAEPGHLLRAPHRGDGIAIASHFTGQTPAILTLRDGGSYDSLSEARAQAPLRLEVGPPGQGIAIARHRGFGSNAVFPVGPRGFDRIDGRGEGSLAILFDDDQRAVGLLVHADYADPLGTRPATRGTVEVIVLDRAGRVLARPVTPVSEGVTALGYQTASGAPLIAGLVLLNTDPGGIAVDDILYARAGLMGRAPQVTPDLRQASWQADRAGLLSRHAEETAQILPLQP